MSRRTTSGGGRSPPHEALSLGESRLRKHWACPAEERREACRTPEERGREDETAGVNPAVGPLPSPLSSQDRPWATREAGNRSTIFSKTGRQTQQYLQGLPPVHRCQGRGSRGNKGAPRKRGGHPCAGDLSQAKGPRRAGHSPSPAEALNQEWGAEAVPTARHFPRKERLPGFPQPRLGDLSSPTTDRELSQPFGWEHHLARERG